MHHKGLESRRIIELALKELYQTPFRVWISVRAFKHLILFQPFQIPTHFQGCQKIMKSVKKSKLNFFFVFIGFQQYFLNSRSPYDLHSSLNFSHLFQSFATPANPESVSIACIWFNWDLKQDWSNFPLPLYSYTPSQNIPELS